MTTIGLIGAGNIGSAVAHLAVQAGYDVVLSNSRGPETLADLVAELGDAGASGHRRGGGRGRRPRGGDDPAEELRRRAGRAAARQGRHRHRQLLPAARRPDRRARRRVDDDLRAASRRTCRSRRSSRASTTSTTAHSRQLARPAGDPERSTLALAGDDADAKAAVAEFLDDIGYDAYDAGPLSEGWRYQRDLPAYAQLYSADPPGTWPPQAHRPVSREFLLEQLGKAQRYRDM